MKKKSLSELGQRLENVRLALRLQQKEMARGAGMAPGHLSDLINGKRGNPGIETILKIAKGFNISLNYVYPGACNTGDQGDRHGKLNKN
jgi:transcriptional regulator with XRE-family HTH domain